MSCQFAKAELRQLRGRRIGAYTHGVGVGTIIITDANRAWGRALKEIENMEAEVKRLQQIEAEHEALKAYVECHPNGEFKKDEVAALGLKEEEG